MMKSKIITMLLCLALPVAANAMEFQSIGALGIGGAGVARTTDAYASYWNPAGLAFYEKPFSAKLNAGAGININSTLADDIDKLGKLNLNDLQNLTFTNTANTAANAAVTAQAVEFVGIINDLNHNQGTLTVTADPTLAFQYRNFGLGGFVSGELASFANADTTNVRPGDPTNVSIVSFGQGIGALDAVGNPNPTTPGTLFSTSQRSNIVAAFTTANPAFSAQQATAIVNTLEAQLQQGDKTGQTSQQLADALIHMAQSFGTGNSIQNNLSTLEYRGIILTDIPIAYGHKFDLKEFGQIAIGGSIKVMQGRTFASYSQIVKVNSSGDIVKNITDRYVDSTNVGLDLGALWRYRNMLNVGVVAKNLNSPEFDMPQFTTLQNTRFNQKVRVDPQVRMGVAVDPLSWLSIAADADLTRNSTLLPGRDSRNVGGGLDLHPLSWFALRAGMYSNLAESSTGPVGTFGLTFGPKWLRMDIDGAVAFETAKYKDSTYPREARVEFGMSTMF